MRKYQVSITVFIEAINGFEAINKFESLVSSKIIRLEKYNVVEVFDEPKVDLPIISENEL